eukprot:Opistho-2@2217
MPPKFTRGPPRSDVQLAERANLLGNDYDSDEDEDEDVIYGESRGASRGGPSRPPVRAPVHDPKVARVKAEVTEVVGIMKQNIGKVLDRGEKLENLEEKSENLQEGAAKFRRGANTLKKRMWWANMKLRLIVFAIIAAVITIVALIIYFKTKK